jgi:hypothetical protein
MLITRIAGSAKAILAVSSAENKLMPLVKDVFQRAKEEPAIATFIDEVKPDVVDAIKTIKGGEILKSLGLTSKEDTEKSASKTMDDLRRKIREKVEANKGQLHDAVTSISTSPEVNVLKEGIKQALQSPDLAEIVADIKNVFSKKN